VQRVEVAGGPAGRQWPCQHMATVDPQDFQLPLRVAQVIRPSRPTASTFYPSLENLTIMSPGLVKIPWSFNSRVWPWLEQ